MVPAKVQGSWRATVPASVGKGPLSLSLRQQVTRVSGSAKLDGKDVALDDLKIHGEQISFALPSKKATFTGTVKGDAIMGAVEAGGAKAPWSAKLVK
jgi:hypothetical protein